MHADENRGRRSGPDGDGESPPPEPDRALTFLVDAVTDYAIYMLDANGCVTSWNTGARRLKGYEQPEVQGRHFAQFFSEDDRAAGVPEKILAAAARDGKATVEGWRVRKDGTRFWALGTVHAVRDEAGDLIGFAKVTRDMTVQRDAQQALAASERRFRLLVEGVVDYAIYMLDPNGLIANWNKGAERIKGYAADEVLGRHFSLFYTPEDRATGRPARALQTALHEGRFEAEGWRVKKDGSRFWASVVIDPIYDDGQLMGFAKITRDVTERREAQEQLAQSERQFRTLVSGVFDYAIFMLDPNGVVANWNPGAQRIKGYTADEIVGQHFSRFYTEEDRAAGLPAQALKTAAEEGRYEAEAWRVRKDGSLFWASVVIDAVREPDGALIGFAKITRDITDKRRAQLELQRAHDQLTQSQKLEALGKLTGGVAHDFNNLLMVVSGQAQMLQRHAGDNPRVQRAIEAIEAAARRGADLTRHLLSFSRRQRLTPAPMALNDRAQVLRELLGAGLPRQVRLDLEFPDGLWPVVADEGELDLALINLAVNARDAMPNGGVLTVRARNVTLKGRGEGELAGEFVALSIRDSGVGIPPDILPRIFDPFFTTKDVDKGTGLGLSQVYGFAQQSGGRVTVESDLGSGTSFTLTLPRAEHPPQAEAPAQADSEGARHARILVVEDNPEVAEVAARMVEELGHEAHVAANARAALETLAAGEPFDLVFSDIVMAGEMDGLALARRIREGSPDIPILLATGYSEAAERIGGEFPILRKPYTLPELNRAIGARLAAAKLVNLERVRRSRKQR